MARYRRNPLHWLTQPRDMNGRFASRGGSSAGGGGGNDWYFEGLLKLPWWGRMLFVAAALGLGWLSLTRLFLFAPFAWFPPVLLADGVLDMVLPDGADGSSRTMEEKRRGVVVSGILTVLSVVSLISPETGGAVLILLLLLMFLLWAFG